MARIDTWLKNQHPKIRKNLKVVKCDFLHISQEKNIRRMQPRIGWRQYEEEDRTIPRVCGAPTAVDCIYGHTSVRTNILNDTSFNGDDNVSGKYVFYVYRLNIDGIVKPSKRLVPDCDVTNELWVVAHSPESYDIVPEIVGSICPETFSHSVTLGKTILTNSFLLEVKKPFALEKETLAPGYYRFNLNGQLIPDDRQKVTDLTEITKAEYRIALRHVKEAMSPN